MKTTIAKSLLCIAIVTITACSGSLPQNSRIRAAQFSSPRGGFITYRNEVRAHNISLAQSHRR